MRLPAALLNAEPITVTGRPWVRLWLAAGDERFPAYVPDVEPAFYVLPADGVDAEALLPAVRERVERAEVVERRVGRAATKVLRCVARHEGDVADLRKGLVEMADVASVREWDVPLHHRLLFDRDLRPAEGVQGTARADPRVDGVVLADAAPAPAPPVAWRVAALAIEAAGADPAKDPALRAAIATPAGVEAIEEAGEPALLARLVERMRELDPDVLLTWNGDVGLFPFLAARASSSGVALAFGRDGDEPEIRGAGLNRSALLTGRAHVDLARVAGRDLRFDVKVKTLAAVAEHLGLEPPGDGAAEEAAGALRVGEALLPLQEAFARLCRVPVDEASRAGRGRQVEFLLLGEAARLGILAPNRGTGGGPEEGADPFEGGFVLDPVPGLHEHVTALDFGAMYPTIMIHYNVSPDTRVEPAPAANVAPEVGHAFLKEPDGFLRRILRDLVTRRKALKKEMRTLSEGAERSRVDVEQSSIKVLTNAIYGYTGWEQARWGDRACAEATAAWGRAHIKWVMDEARKRGMEVLYGDTDSLFLKTDQDLAPFVADVNRALPIELDVAERYATILFTKAKKKYAGLSAGGRVVARGFEVRRGDWCEYARATQEAVLEAVLRKRDAQEGLRVAREAIERLSAGGVDVDALVVWKTLTTRPEAYKSKPMHAAAVERARAANPDLPLPLGAKVGVVVTSGSGPAHDRAVLRALLGPGDAPDVDWYVEKQVVPAAERILDAFGITAEEIKGKPRQRSLFEF